MVLIVLKSEHLGKEIFSEFNPKLRHQKISYSKCIFMYIAIFSFFIMVMKIFILICCRSVSSRLEQIFLSQC